MLEGIIAEFEPHSWWWACYLNCASSPRNQWVTTNTRHSDYTRVGWWLRLFSGHTTPVHHAGARTQGRKATPPWSDSDWLPSWAAGKPHDSFQDILSPEDTHKSFENVESVLQDSLSWSHQQRQKSQAQELKMSFQMEDEEAMENSWNHDVLDLLWSNKLCLFSVFCIG